MATPGNASHQRTKPVPTAGGKREHPLARFGEVLVHLPNYTRLGWGLFADERVPGRQKATLAAGLGYLALPLDLVPGIIPVAGQLDDLAAVLLALRSVVRALPSDVTGDHLARAGLTQADLDRDLRSLGVTAIWLAYRGGRLVLGAVTFAAGMVAKAVRAPLRPAVPSPKQGAAPAHPSGAAASRAPTARAQLYPKGHRSTGATPSSARAPTANEPGGTPSGDTRRPG